MKKAILFTAALTLGISISGKAQDKYVVSANVAMNQGNLDEAKDDIDKAMANPETSEKPKALWAKAQIYYSLIGVEKYKLSNPAYETVQALIKLAEVKPDYEKNAANQQILHFVSTYFNDGVKTYNDTNNHKRYEEVADTMRIVIKLCDLNGGKRFENLKPVDSIKARAAMVLANSYYFNEKYEEAIPLLVNVKNNPITKTPAAYENLIDADDKTKHTADEGAAIMEARAAFPDNEILRNDELNYYIVTGKEDELIKKLEDAVAKDPKNADLEVTLASAYTGLAEPKSGKKPANSADYMAKAETAYKKSVELSPDNAEFNYFAGAFYFNQGVEVNNDINAITGSSDADMKKYNALKVNRDALFDKALPYIEKSYTILDAKAAAGTLKDNERTVYFNTKKTLYNIYLVQSKTDKADAIKKKMGQ